MGVSSTRSTRLSLIVKYGTVRPMRRWRLALGLAVLLALLVFTGTASAAVRSAAFTFNPNATSPTFNPTSLPAIQMSVSYDDQAGTVVVSESGEDPSYGSGWAPFVSVDLSGPGSATPMVTISGDLGSDRLVLLPVLV